MSLVVGIDEVGYGPKLGPFVVCAVALEAPRGEVDLRDVGVPVRDSKKLFTQARGIASLEPTALAFLGRLWPLEGLSHSRLWSHLSTDSRDAPWYGDLDLPCAGSSPPLLRLPPGVRMVGAWARILEPSAYNAQVGENKADLLFDCAADLVKRAGRAEFYIGKQGGRRFYLRHITRHLGAASVREEFRDRSSYETKYGRLTFLMDGEDRHPLIALASIIGKYVRETSMRLFNAWWAERASVRPTAGYGADGRRFWSEIEPYLAAHGLTRDEVLRRR